MTKVAVLDPEIVELPPGPVPSTSGLPLYCQYSTGTGEPEATSAIIVLTPLVAVNVAGPVTAGGMAPTLMVSNTWLLVLVPNIFVTTTKKLPLSAGWALAICKFAVVEPEKVELPPGPAPSDN